jgi:hypothetical protein
VVGSVCASAWPLWLIGRPPAPAPHPAVTLEELSDDQEYADIMEDMKEECGKYGAVVQVHIPRPPPPGTPNPPGLGKIIIEFARKRWLRASTPAGPASSNTHAPTLPVHRQRPTHVPPPPLPQTRLRPWGRATQCTAASLAGGWWRR